MLTDGCQPEYMLIQKYDTDMYILLYVLAHLVIKPESNMLRIILIIPSSTSQNISIILIVFSSLPTIPMLYVFFCYSYNYCFNC